MKTKLFVVSLIALVILFQALSWHTKRSESSQLSSTRESRPLGHSHLFKFLSQKEGVDFRLRGAPLESLEDLRDIQMILLMDPRMSIFSREAKLLESWVRSGGVLFIQVLDAVRSRGESFRFSNQNWLESMNISPSIVFNESFSNSEIQKIKDGNRTLAFYSDKIFKSEDCRDGEQIECFWQTWSLGEGRVHLQLGASIFSNALLTQEDNAEQLFDILETTRVFLFDEYLIWGTSRSAKDLVLHPKFLTAVLSLCLITFLYLIFARQSPLYPLSWQSRKNQAPTFQEFGLDFLRPAFQRPVSYFAALRQYQNDLETLFPKKKGFIQKRAPARKESLGQCLSEARKLVALHQDLLSERYRKKGNQS